MSVISEADVRTQIDLLLESDLSDRPGFLGERVLGLPVTSGWTRTRHGRTSPGTGASTGYFVVGKSTLRSRTAMPAPRACTRTNIGAFVGSIPVKVSERVRAIVTAGLANPVDDVK